MEYEMSGEEPLFDESTNPSLQPGSDPASEARSTAKRKEQAVSIPDEEPAVPIETQMG